MNGGQIMSGCGCQFDEDRGEEFLCSYHERHDRQRRNREVSMRLCCEDAANAAVQDLPALLDLARVENIRAAVRDAVAAWITEDDFREEFRDA